jgi:hypothetical protein
MSLNFKLTHYRIFSFWKRFLHFDTFAVCQTGLARANPCLGRFLTSETVLNPGMLRCGRLLTGGCNACPESVDMLKRLPSLSIGPNESFALRDCHRTSPGLMSSEHPFSLFAGSSALFGTGHHADCFD